MKCHALWHPCSKISHLIPINSVLTSHASSPSLRIKIKLNAVNQIWAQNNLYIFAFNICQNTTKWNDFFFFNNYYFYMFHDDWWIALDRFFLTCSISCSTYPSRTNYTCHIKGEQHTTAFLFFKTHHICVPIINIHSLLLAVFIHRYDVQYNSNNAEYP